MRVYLVTRNDFPDSVFATVGAAQRYLMKQRATEDDKRAVDHLPRINWAYHAFDVEEAA